MSENTVVEMGAADVAAVLARGFRHDELEWKVQTSGVNTNSVGAGNPEGVWARVVPYVTSRAIVKRLIEAFGPAGFDITLAPMSLGQANGMIATIECRWPNGTVTRREDVAELSDIEALKGAASGAIKRAAVQYEIGSYLYQSPDFYAVIGDDGPNRGYHKGKNGGKDVRYRWHLPAEASEWVAETSGRPMVAAPAPSQSNAPSSPATGSPPPSPAGNTAARTTPSSDSPLMPGKDTWFKGTAGQPIGDVEGSTLVEARDWYRKRIAEKPTDRWIAKTKADLAVIETEIDRRRGGLDEPPPPEEPGFEEEDDDLPF